MTAALVVVPPRRLAVDDLIVGRGFILHELGGEPVRYRAVAAAATLGPQSAAGGWYCIELPDTNEYVPQTQVPCLLTDGVLLEADRDSRLYALSSREDPARARFEGSLSAERLAILGERWRIVERVLRDHGKYLRHTERPAFLDQLVTEKFSKTTVRWLMTLFYVGGCYREALIDDLDKSGGPGKSRAKRLRLAVSGTPTTAPDELFVGDGRIATAADIDVMDAMIEARVLTSGRTRISRRRAWLSLLDSAFTIKYGDPTTDIGALHLTIEGFSLSQFRRRCEHLTKTRDAIVAQAGERVTNHTLRERLRRVSHEGAGPGEEAELDCWDVREHQLLSEIDRNIVLGSPYVYAFMDRAFGACIGAIASFAPPSYEAALSAMLAAVAMKSEYCRRFGIVVDDVLFPHFGFPTRWVGDRGEMQGLKWDPWPVELGIDIVNLGPGRPELKPSVEGFFGQNLTTLVEQLPGTLTANQRERGLKAELPTLTLRAFNALLTWAVIRYNCSLVPEAGVPDWVREAGIYTRRRSALTIEAERVYGTVRREVNIDQVRLRHMKPVDVETSEDGILLNGFHYWSEWTKAQGWFLRGTRRKPKQLKAIQDHDAVGRAWLVDPPGGKTHRLYLVESDAKYADISLHEMRLYEKRIAELRRREDYARTVAEIAISGASDTIVALETKATRDARRAATARTATIAPAPPPIKLLPGAAPLPSATPDTRQSELLDVLRKKRASESTPG